MITMTFKDLNEKPVVQAIQKLANHPFGIKTAYQVGKIAEKVVAHAQEAINTHEMMLAKHGTRNEEGVVIFATDEARVAYEKELSDFLAVEFTINRHKLAMSQIENAKLSPVELLALEPIIEVDSAEETGPGAA